MEKIFYLKTSTDLLAQFVMEQNCSEESFLFGFNTVQENLQ